MEYLSKKRDSLLLEVLQCAHDESEARVNSPETQLPSEHQESDFGDMNQKSRKKQKVDSGDYQSQIDTLQKEAAELKDRLASPKHQSSSLAHKLGKLCIEAKQTAAIMKRKLAVHAHWLQRVSSLMETAPLLDFIVPSSEGKENHSILQSSLSALDKWRGEAKQRPHPRLRLDDRLRAAVTICQANAFKLLQDAREKSPLFQQSLEFESHGWKIITGTLLNDHIGFSCHRILPPGMTCKAKEVAMALWNSVERDEIFRTFVPLVQDSIITYQETDCSLSCRVLLLSQETPQQAVATVEAINSTQGEEGPWQISMEAVHDHYLCSFVADASGDSVMPNTCPPVKLDLGLQMSKLNMHNNFLMGAKVSKIKEGVDIFIAGSAHFDLPYYREPTLDLLQHFVSHMPVYEDLHLTALVDCHDKTGADAL
ncbi:hypothetical protein Plhal304r1_c007g0029041 [Plasmopara halstedii]